MRVLAAAGVVLLIAISPAAEPTPDPEQVAELVRRLGDPVFARRETATRDLERIGEPAISPLRAAASGDNPEVRRRASSVLRTIAERVTRRETAKLQGEWYVVAYDADGRRLKGVDKAHRITFDGDRWAITVAGHVAQAGTISRIEPGEKVSTIDLAITQGGNVGATATSVYALDGDSLRYLNCGEPRPAEIVTKPGDGRHLLTLRRVAP